MKKKKLTLKDLTQMHKVQTTSMPVNGGVKGTKDNPYTKEEAYYLIDKGLFKGGIVSDNNGPTYWLGEAEVVAYNSASKEDVIFDFNSDFYVEFCNNYYGSDCYPFGTSASSISLPYADGTTSDIIGALDTAGDALEKSPKKINYGSNGKFYFETKTGRVFCGNQYVGTTSVNGVGAFVSKYVGKIDIALTVYNVVATYKNEGVEAAGKEAAVSIGGMAGSKIGRWAAATLGAELGAEVGVWGGPAGAAIGGVIGGIIGAVGGQVLGSYLVEIAVE